MLPLVLAQQVRRTLLDYLRTTFRLRDHALERALFTFLQHPEHGIFRGPYLDVRLPFRQSAATDPVPLDVHPSFPPYAHQLQAWHRLTTAASNRPRPTLVTTGTGSGKTECFLYPLLDHCAREHAAGNKHGIKAIILYPMNALASDQAERIARELWNNPRLKNKVRAGLYVGGETSTPRKFSGPTHLIDDRDTLRQSPPDILLTNYRMLDFLLMRPDDSRLWQHNSATTLQYLVLDELHTYDGAQGSDVACLIRRLRERLDIPEGHLCPVGSSATIGSGGDEAKRLLLRFASDVFGAPFDDDAIVGESRLSLDEAFPPDDVREDFPDLSLPSNGIDPLDPATHDSRAAYLDAQARLWLDCDASDPVGVGDRLKDHDFLRVVLRSLHAGRHAGPRNLDEVCATIADQDPDFAKLDDRQSLALVSFLSLVSHARRVDGERGTPLLHVQVQYWIRELRHLVRRVGEGEPAFDWRDEIPEDDTAHFLPIVYCRECGHDGLGAIMREGEDKLIEHDVGQAWLSRRRIARFVELGAAARPEPLPEGAAPEQQEIPQFLCARCLRCSPGQTPCSVQDCPGKTIPARLHAKLSEKKHFLADCPRCHAADGLSMLASRAASLSSVAISELFLSRYNDDRKLLAFSDSVQDASHRAGFFAKDDREELDHLKQRLVDDGYEIDPKEKGLGATTTAAIAAHLSHLAGDLKLDPYDFLGEHGQYSMQACSEFNPLRRLSRSLADKLTPEQRAAAERTNRRVVAFFFEPGTHVDGWWPCPKPGTGPAKCGTRLWSNAKTRRSTDDPSREFFPKGAKGKPSAPIVRAHDTFECRFYERIAFDSPCERAEVWKPPKDPDPPPPPPPNEDDPDFPKRKHWPQINKPGKPPKKDPPKPRKEIDWEVMIGCSHGSGTRLNSGKLRADGILGGTGKDILQIVPEAGGDRINVSVDPESAMNHVDITVDGKLLSWMGSGKESVSFLAPHVSTSMDHPITLYARFKTVRPSHEVLVEGAKGSHTAKVERFPDKKVSADAEALLDAIRWALLPLVKLIQEAGEMFSDDFEFKLLEDEDTELEFSARWKEWPSPTHFDPSVMDYRAFYSYRALFAMEPLCRVEGTLEFTLLQLLKRLRRFDVLKKPVERLLGLLPEVIVDVLESMKLTVKPEIGGGGRFEARRDRPEEKLLEVSDREGADQWEFPLELKLDTQASATLEEVLDGWVDEASVSVTVMFDAQALIGIIADMVADEYGFYWRAKIEDVDVHVKIDTPFDTLDIDEPFNVVKARKWGPKRVILVSGDE